MQQTNYLHTKQEGGSGFHCRDNPGTWAKPEFKGDLTSSIRLTSTVRKESTGFEAHWAFSSSQIQGANFKGRCKWGSKAGSLIGLVNQLDRASEEAADTCNTGESLALPHQANDVGAQAAQQIANYPFPCPAQAAGPLGT